jgi:pimeloyl-ACP methyl ester carboxylesterase
VPADIRLAVAEDGTRLAVRAHPGDFTQVPFVLVHGLSSNARLWDGVAGGLSAAGHPSFAPDLRGHGQSERPPGGYDFGTVAGDLWTVLRDVVERSAVLVGQSWGGNVVIETALRHPALVRGVVCVDGGFLRLRDRHPDWETAWAALAPPVFDHLTGAELRRRMEERFAGWPPGAVPAQLANFEDGDGTVRPRLPRERHRDVLRHLWEHDPDPVAASLDVPVRVVAVGRHDPGKEERVERFAAGLRHGSVTWLEGDHDVHAQQPDAVVDVLLDLGSEWS